MKYIRYIDVVYGDSTNSLGNCNINEGFKGTYLTFIKQGEDVYLVPVYTENRVIAAMKFISSLDLYEDFSGHDYSKGDGGMYSKQRSGDGSTEDLNREWGGTPLYLCWKYADEEPRKLQESRELINIVLSIVEAQAIREEGLRAISSSEIQDQTVASVCHYAHTLLCFSIHYS
ncbi:hypothetical protein DFH29DRAFT_877906 [Suillus ampliporus]|nr:hypothetical protein DFH29DRAFT_877906 [Suillus ampliporus]